MSDVGNRTGKWNILGELMSRTHADSEKSEEKRERKESDAK